MISLEYLRQFRFSGYAIFDLVVSFLGIYLLSPILSKIFLKFNLEIPRTSWLFFTLPLGLLIHLLTGNLTLMTQNFMNPHGHYILKIVILIFLILGLKGIKIIR